MYNEYEEYIKTYKDDLQKANGELQKVSDATYSFLKDCNKKAKKNVESTSSLKVAEGPRIGTKINLVKLSGENQDKYYSGLLARMDNDKSKIKLQNYLIPLKVLVNFKLIFLKELKSYRDNINTIAGRITNKIYLGEFKNILGSVAKLKNSKNILESIIKNNFPSSIDTSKFTKIIQAPKMNNIDNTIEKEKSRVENKTLTSKISMLQQISDKIAITQEDGDIWNNIQECRKKLLHICDIIDTQMPSEIESIISDLHKTANDFYQKNCSDVKATLKARSKVPLIKCIADAKKDPKYDTVKKVMNELPKNVRNNKKNDINAILKIIKPIGKIPKKTS